MAPDPRTGLEMTLLRMLAFRPAGVPVISKAKTKAPQAAETESSPAAASATSAAEGEEWHGLLPRLELSGPVRELARNIQLESKSGDRWQFLIPDSVRHLGSDSVVQKLQSALASQLGHPVSLALHAASEPVPTPAVLGEQATLEKLSDAERAIEQDPTVQALKERFGARLIEDSVQPLQ
jgi:DNA polymerase-3 subunit gamma/tau